MNEKIVPLFRIRRIRKQTKIAQSTFNFNIMLKEKAGELAGTIWEALHQNGKLTAKELKRITKVRADKDLYLGLGWLLREDKITTEEADKEISISLK